MSLHIDCKETKKKLEEGTITLLDVREQDEYDQDHIKGCMHIPLGELSDRVDEIPKDKPVVCYCLHGGRSKRAAMFLNGHGYDAQTMEGGIAKWSEEIEE